MNKSFESIWKSKIPFKSKADLYENLYLQAIIDSYGFVDKHKGKEEEIRDRFYADLTQRNPLTKYWFDLELLDIGFEKWKMDNSNDKSRVDLSFFWSGFGHFEIECKRLFQQPSKNEAYLNDGLVRFINLKYADKNEYAGMIGFVVTGAIDKIQNELANRILDFHSDNTATNNQELNWKNSFVSYHEKKDHNKIMIYHLLFQFTDKE